jgi:hypothetical protein
MTDTGLTIIEGTFVVRGDATEEIVPDYHTINSFLSVRNADALIAAYQQVLQARYLAQ